MRVLNPGGMKFVDVDFSGGKKTEKPSEQGESQ